MSSTMKVSPPWANRIVGHGEEAPEQLLPNPRNWRLHGAAQQGALSQVLGEVGLVQSVIVNRSSGHLIDGHLRVELAKAQGQPSVPVVYVELSEEEESVILASLDPIAAMAGADREKLAELLASIESDDEAVRALLEGIARQERLELPALAGLTDPDEIPAPPEQPVSKADDVWLAGDHRLMVGDSTRTEHVGCLMSGERAVLMATDPPYLVDYDGGNHPQTWGRDGRPITSAEKTKHWDAYSDPESSVAFYEAFLRSAVESALERVVPIYMFFGMMRAPIVFSAWERAGLLLHQILVWYKSRVVLGRCDYCWNFEPIAYGWVKSSRPAPERRPPANAAAVWEIASTEGNEAAISSHPTVKAVALIRRPIEYHTRPGELIYEPFSGSGTAIIAAEQTGRRCYALEISAAFCDVAVLRWQRFAGKQAVLAGDGRSFEEIAAERTGHMPPGSALGGSSHES